MGIVYRGFDPILERDVALKTMMSSFTIMDEESRSRFYREARSAGKLRHRNIVTIYDMGEDQGVPYIAMELLEGIDLHRKMKTEGPLAPVLAVEIVAQVASGLSYAHGFGIVHRDIKPANIFIVNEGTVKILDFGIAKLAASEMTRSGIVMGTVDYMSPEQIRADRTMDGRSDLFSVGVILYELLSAQKPFPGETLTQVMYKIVYEEPVDIATVRQLPAELAAVVSRALQKDPAARFQTGEELASVLWQLCSDLGGSSVSGRHSTGSLAAPKLAPLLEPIDSEPTVDATLSFSPSEPAAPPTMPIPAPTAPMPARAEPKPAPTEPIPAPLAEPPPKRVVRRDAAPKQQEPSRSRLPLAGAILTVLIAVAGGIFYLRSSAATQPPPAPRQERPIPAESAPVPPPAVAAPGFAAIDAAPWAGIARLEDVATNDVIAITGGETTPFLVELPPGRYRLKLRHPDFGETTAQFDVSSGSVTRLFETMPGFTAPPSPQRSDR